MLNLIKFFLSGKYFSNQTHFALYSKSWSWNTLICEYHELHMMKLNNLYFFIFVIWQEHVPALFVTPMRSDKQYNIIIEQEKEFWLSITNILHH
jgi:hypothetical protein